MLLLFVAVFHWSNSPAPTGQLDWAGFTAARQQSLATASGQMYPMELMALLMGIQDKAHGHSWRVIKTRLVRAAAGGFLVYGSAFPVAVVGLYAWLFPAAFAMASTRCWMVTRISAESWFLLAMILWGFLAASVESLAPERSKWLSPLLAFLCHFVCFSNNCPWPFLRAPLQYDQASTVPLQALLPTVNTGLVSMYVFYQVGARCVPADFPNRLPFEPASRRGSAAVRFLWVAVPWLWARAGLHIPEYNAMHVPYAGLECARGRGRGTPETKRCILARVREQQCSWRSQWSLSAASEDFLALVAVMCCAVALGALIPRRRLPVFTYVGQHAFVCYIASSAMSVLLAPPIEWALNMLVNLGVLAKTVSTVNWALVYIAFLSAFYALACTSQAWGQLMMRLSSRVQARYTLLQRGAAGHRHPYSTASRVLAVALCVALLYDPRPASCEVHLTRAEVAHPRSKRVKASAPTAGTCLDAVPPEWRKRKWRRFNEPPVWPPALLLMPAQYYASLDDSSVRVLSALELAERQVCATHGVHFFRSTKYVDGNTSANQERYRSYFAHALALRARCRVFFDARPQLDAHPLVPARVAAVLSPRVKLLCVLKAPVARVAGA